MRGGGARAGAGVPASLGETKLAKLSLMQVRSPGDEPCLRDHCDRRARATGHGAGRGGALRPWPVRACVSLLTGAASKRGQTIAPHPDAIQPSPGRPRGRVLARQHGTQHDDASGAVGMGRKLTLRTDPRPQGRVLSLAQTWQPVLALPAAGLRLHAPSGSSKTGELLCRELQGQRVARAVLWGGAG